MIKKKPWVASKRQYFLSDRALNMSENQYGWSLYLRGSQDPTQEYSTQSVIALETASHLDTYCLGRDTSYPTLLLVERKYAGSWEALQLGSLALGMFQFGVVQLG